MRKSFKKVLAVATAAAMTIGGLSLSACSKEFRHPEGIPEGDVRSNGGFVVSVGDYYYFINGVETYTSDNTYGAPVKGALMRVKKADVAEGHGENAQRVIPSLMVAGDYTAGLFVYGDRIYYATPNNVKNTSGVIENNFLDFKSAKLDGSDIKSMFRLESNTTVYRYVEVEGTVYVLYIEGTSSPYTLHSYNTKSGADTVLAKGATAYLLDSVDKTNPNIYYTMGVTVDADTDNPRAQSYNQIYTVRADATKVPEGYKYGEKDYWDADYLKENNNEAPYVNLGTIVLDGVGSASDASDFNHGDVTKAGTPLGYTYALQTYKDKALYFTRSQTTGTAGGSLYYLPETATAGSWDSVTGNDGLTCIANSIDAGSKATSSAYFYQDTNGHHYLYVANSSLYRVDVGDGGAVEQELEIAYDIGTATIVAVDSTSGGDYGYVYFTRTNSSGLSVERAVYNGEAEDYRNLTKPGEDNDDFKSVKVLDLQHANNWYPYEIIDGNVFYADAETFGGTSYSYVSTVSLMKDGALMDNIELEAFNDRYRSVVDSSDEKVGLFAKLNKAFGDSDLSNALKYYFYTGKTQQFYDNIEEAKTYGQKDTSLYTQEEQDAFKAITEGQTYELDGKVLFKAEDAANLSYSAFRTKLGSMTEADEDSYANYWKTSGLAYYTPPAPEEHHLAWWAWVLIAFAIAIVVAAAVLVPLYFYDKKRKKAAEPVRWRKVDTTDNRDIDVYATEPEEPEVSAEPATPEASEEPEPPEETAEATAEATADSVEAEAPAPEEAPEVPEEKVTSDVGEGEQPSEE